MPPRRIDFLTSIDGVEFEEAWKGRVSARLGDVDAIVIGRDALVRNKRAAGRPKDRVDLRILEASGRPRRQRKPKR